MIKIKDIAYVRLGAPDLDSMARFLEDFGFALAQRDDDALYARGTDASPYVHLTERGEPGFRGLGFEAGSEEDLRRLAQEEGAAVEEIAGFAGGLRLRLRDPNGYEIDVVHGREPLEPLPVPTSLTNRGTERRRRGRLQVARGPARVKRIGHAGVLVGDFQQSVDWYKSRFGLLASDDIYIGDESQKVGSFMRCDLGDEVTDHHTLVCFAPPGGGSGLDHASFEVEDHDAVWTGHEHLAQAGYKHKMGVGRHILGSQVFDYWCDPWGHVLEHYADGDLLDAAEPTGLHDPGVALGTHWGSLAL